jgi:chitinase
MASDEKNRLSFAADCQRVVLEFGLDGIDIDWEYPTSSLGNISSSPDDTENFTLLMRDIRKATGKKKLLTFASVATAEYVDFKSIDKYVDFVNIMTYDIAYPPYHHAGLYRSEFTEGVSVEEAAIAHIEGGIPANKLTLGMPFYGKVSADFRHPRNYRDLIKLTDYTAMWDDVAKAPYLTNANGKFVCSYETPQSIALKCDFIKAKGLLGAMYWEYSGDDEDGTLRKAVYHGVMDN